MCQFLVFSICWNPKKQSNLIEQMRIEKMWYHILYKYHESSSLDIGQWWWNYAVWSNYGTPMFFSTFKFTNFWTLSEINLVDSTWSQHLLTVFPAFVTHFLVISCIFPYFNLFSHHHGLREKSLSLRWAMGKTRFMLSNWGFVAPKKSQWNNPFTN